jgi:hypothetical protein
VVLFWGTVFSRRFAICWLSRPAVGYIAAGGDQDLCAVPQTVGPVDDNPVAKRKT